MGSGCVCIECMLWMLVLKVGMRIVGGIVRSCWSEGRFFGSI